MWEGTAAQCLKLDLKKKKLFDNNTSPSLFGCLQILEEEKVHELLNIGEFPLYMIPLDEDVFSFELELAQKVCGSTDYIKK